MGIEVSRNSEVGDIQCCAQRESSRMRTEGPFFGGDSDSLATPRDNKNQPHENENRFGVGLVFRNMRDGKLIVDSFIKDSSAYQSGVVRDGDILISVNGVNIDTVRPSEISKLLLGPFESSVQLTFSRPVDSKAKTPRRSAEGVGHNELPATNGLGSPRSMQPRRSEEIRWASRKMQSYAPSYETVWVQLSRRTPSDVLDDAANQAQQEAISRMRR